MARVKSRLSKKFTAKATMHCAATSLCLPFLLPDSQYLNTGGGDQSILESVEEQVRAFVRLLKIVFDNVVGMILTFKFLK